MEHYYNFGLVALSVVLAVIASFAALGLASRIPHIARDKAPLWLAGGAIAMGLGIWSMHFVGMLAFHLPIPLAYDLGITLLSVVIAIIASGVALFIVRNGIHSKQLLYTSATLMGLGIAGMHYTGMAALKMSPPIDYRPSLVLLSIVIAIFASLFALRYSFNHTKTAPILFTRRRFGAAVLMGVAIAGMHYTGMAAANFSADALCLASPKGVDAPALALIISFTTVFILTLTVLMLVFDIRMAEKNAMMVRQLQRHNTELKQRAEALAEEKTEQLRQSYQRDRMLATIVEQSEEALITTDLDDKINSWNYAATRIFGFTPDEALGQPLALIEPVEDANCNCELGLPDQIGGDSHSFLRRRHKNGETVYVSIQTAPMHDNDGRRTGTIHMLRDVTQRYQSHQQLVLWSSVFTHSGEGIVITDSNNRIIAVNDTFTAVTGYSQEEVLGKNPSLLSSGRQDKPFYEQMWNTITNEGAWKGEVWNKRKNGSIYPEWLTISTLSDPSGNLCNYIAIFSDATLYKEKEERIEYLAYHDKLTGLPNRSLLEDRLGQAIAHARRRKNRVALLFLDLDRFKLINDTLGHHLGDKLLQETAQRLQQVVRSDDTVCRQGGDEFLILIHELELVEDAAYIAHKVLATLSQDYHIDGELLKNTPSIGISIYPDDANDIEALIKNADTAMYHAKASGRSNYQFYTAELNDRIQERMRLEKALVGAIERNELELHFQPQINLASGELSGAEVLLRWLLPGSGYISPDKFIPVAEDSHFIEPIGEWVLVQTARQLGQWLEQGIDLEKLEFAVNISARQLEGNRLQTCIDALFEQYPYLEGTLELEVTETAVMKDVARSVEKLRALKAHNISIAVDDFGTGYSSLSYLKRLPIDRLKIDRAFIRDIPDDQDDTNITEAILSLAKALGLSVVAEGIETATQEAFLLERGCNIGQGYYYGKPLPVDEFKSLLEQYQKPS